MYSIVKELIKDFKSIYKNDRQVLVAMVFLLLTGAILFILPITNLNPATPKIWARYTDVSSGYAEGDWWYLLSFSVLAVVVSIVHCMIGARLYAKRGAGVAMTFLIISIAIVLIGVGFLLKILGRG